MNGRTQPYFFAFDTKSVPGKILGHCVRVETIEIEGDNFDQTKFAILGADFSSDKRIRQLIQTAAGFAKINGIALDAPE
jgi:hypothetical protein